MDALAVRAARRVGGLQALAGDPEVCRAARAALRAVDLALAAAGPRLRTAASLFEGDSGAPYEEASTLQRRLSQLQAARDGELEPGLAAAGCGEDPPPAAPPEPRVLLPLELRAPVDGQVAVFLRADPARVLWASGTPVASAGPDGWAVAAVQPGPVTLCAAPAEAAECRGGVDVDSAMGAAFDLRPPAAQRSPDSVAP
jgi:hypothetical protein